MLTLVPCDHYWLAVEYRTHTVVALCKHYGCRKRGVFSREEWDLLKIANLALDKPVRV